MATQSAFDFERRVPDICSRKHHGNVRSIEANKKANPFKESTRNRVCDLVKASGSQGMTSAELEELLGKPKHKFSGRISALKAEGILQVRGDRDGCDVLVHMQFA